jgi:anti-sigma regulatory factor (Ser/Thr protein kinase)
MGSETIRIKGRYAQVQTVRDLVQRSAEHAGFSSKEAYACQLAVSEAVENIIQHGYGQEVQNEIEVTVINEPGDLIIELTDDAPPFNPTNNRKQDQWTIDDPPVGGLGIHIIHTIMDKVVYKREQGRNLLKLHKKKRETLESTE